MKMTKTAVVAAALLVASLPASADIQLVSPSEGEEILLLPVRQMEVMALATAKERHDALHADREAARAARKKGSAAEDEKMWRVSRPLALKWRTTNGEKGPWLVRVAKTREAAESPVAKDALVITLDGNGEDGSAVSKKSKDGTVLWSYDVKGANLELGRRYYWKVWSRVKCPEFYCRMPTFDAPCKCGKTKQGTSSGVGTFTTDPSAPRWMAVEGRVKNFRDLGGWQTEFGRRVRQGRVFRGQGLNENSFSGLRPGRNRLMVADVEYMKGTLGIKTDLDLRSEREVGGMSKSPLGDGVNFVHNSSEHYVGIFDRKGMDAMAKNVKLFADESNYPVYFHCIAGADRTGSLAYVLNGLCGVSRHDLEVDWEATFYPKVHGTEDVPVEKRYWRSSKWFDEGFAKYGDEGSSLRERIELYLLDCGVTREEMERVRELMLEPAAVAAK